MPGVAEWLVIFGMIVFGIPLLLLVNVLPFWMICKKAGFPGALALLMLVPLANLILPFYLAFAAWPALRPPGPAAPA